MNPANHRRVRADDGFTLLEMVIAVALLGIILVPLTGVVFSFMRHTVDTQARLTESHDVQFAAAYWQRDVASIGVRSSTYDTVSHSYPLVQSIDVSPSCGLPAGATAVVTLAWSEYPSLDPTQPPTLVKVTYASRPDGAVYELLRVRCGSKPSTVQISDSLLAPPAAPVCIQPSGGSSCTDGDAGVPVVVQLKLRVKDPTSSDPTPYDVTLSGERRQS